MGTSDVMFRRGFLIDTIEDAEADRYGTKVPPLLGQDKVAVHEEKGRLPSTRLMSY